MYVYMIFSNSKKLCYVGSTSLHIKTRIANHISSYKQGRSKCSSIKVLMCSDYEIKVLEKFDEDVVSIKALKMKEREYINIQKQLGFEVVNKNVPARLAIEYYYDNKDLLLQKQKNRYSDDPEFKAKIIKSAKDRYYVNREFQRLSKVVQAFDL